MTKEAAATHDELLRALVVLLAQQRDDLASGEDPKRSEIVLAEAGFSAATIASVLGRNPEAVRSTVRRATSRSKS